MELPKDNEPDHKGWLRLLGRNSLPDKWILRDFCLPASFWHAEWFRPLAVTLGTLFRPQGGTVIPAVVANITATATLRPLVAGLC
jgi:hypothetical protein